MRKALWITTMISIFLLFSLLSYVALNFGIKNNTKKESPAEACINLCLYAKSKINLSNGPCLSDIYKFNETGWVCDVAHRPRISSDNLPQNECKPYIERKASHFVEVDQNCNFIREN